MPNHKSAEKRDKQNVRKNAVNTANRSKLRTELKKLRVAVAASNGSDATTLLPTTVSAIDKAVQKGILHKNAAARHKSRLTKHVSNLAAN